MKKMMVFVLISCLVFIGPGCGKKGTDERAALTEIDVQTVQPFYYAGLRHTGPFSEFQAVVDSFLTLAEQQDLTLTGPLMGIFFNSPDEVAPEQLEWMVAFETEDSTTVRPPLEGYLWRFKKVVKTVHYGAPEKVAETYDKIMRFMQEKNITPGPVAVERYLYPHKAVMNMDSLQTEVWMTVGQQ